MHKNEYTLTWKIKNFSFCNHSTGIYLGTAKICPKNLGKLNFNLNLYPKGKNEKYSEFISFFIFLNAEDCIDFLHCEVKVIGSSGKILKLHKWNYIFEQLVNSHRLECLDLLAIKDIIKDAKDCAQDNLTICCNLSKESPQNLSAGKMMITNIGVDRHTFEMQIDRGRIGKHSINFGSSRNIEFTITETLGSVEISISKLDSKNEKAWFSDCTFTLDKAYQATTYSERASCYFPSARCSKWEFPTDNLSAEWRVYLSECKKIQYIPTYMKFHCEFSCSNGTDFSFVTTRNDPSIFSDTNDVSPVAITANKTTYISLQHDLLTLFHSKKLSDVKFRVSGATIEAHKSVLAARSPVFAAMFDHQDMAETSSGIVNITDIDARIMEIFLKFLYADTIEDMDYEVSTNLLMVAEKYQVLSLKEICSTFLRKEMSAENVCEILSLAEAVNHEFLKLTSIEFIIVNSAAILSSSEWITWMKNNMESATIIFTKLTQSLQNPDMSGMK